MKTAWLKGLALAALAGASAALIGRVLGERRASSEAPGPVLEDVGVVTPEVVPTGAAGPAVVDAAPAMAADEVATPTAPAAEDAPPAPEAAAPTEDAAETQAAWAAALAALEEISPAPRGPEADSEGPEPAAETGDAEASAREAAVRFAREAVAERVQSVGPIEILTVGEVRLRRISEGVVHAIVPLEVCYRGLRTTPRPERVVLMVTLHAGPQGWQSTACRWGGAPA